MKDQHQHIKGYRDLVPAEIALMNYAKSIAEFTGEFFRACEIINAGNVYEPDISKIESTMAREILAKVVKDMQHAVRDHGGRVLLDQRWLAIARTDLQKGFMALTRAIAQPTTF